MRHPHNYREGSPTSLHRRDVLHLQARFATRSKGRCEIDVGAGNQPWNCELLGILSFVPGFQVAYKITFYPNDQMPNPPL